MPSEKHTLSATESSHNYGIDALRILAMLLVLTSHILGCGGILEAAVPMSSQYEAAWFLEIIAYCSVNCYALISGYVGITAKHKYHSIILLWLRVVFYTVGITFLFSLFLPDAVTFKNWIKAILPVTSGYYWYFTSYFALFFFIPLLNVAINAMPKLQLTTVVIGLIFVFFCLQTLLGKEIFGTSSNAWMLMLLYVIGGYIRKYGLFRKCSLIRLFLGYFIMIAFTWFVMFLIEKEVLSFLIPFGGKYLIKHTSPTLLAAGTFLLLIFERIPISLFARKMIAFFAPAAFSVYLIHAHPLVWDYLLRRRFASYAGFSAPMEIILILLTALIVYTLCSFVDQIRIFIFGKLKLKQHLAKLEEKAAQ